MQCHVFVCPCWARKRKGPVPRIYTRTSPFGVVKLNCQCSEGVPSSGYCRLIYKPLLFRFLDPSQRGLLKRSVRTSSSEDRGRSVLGGPGRGGRFRISILRSPIRGEQAHCVRAFAEALEVVPFTLSENAGLPPVEVVTALLRRSKNANLTNLNSFLCVRKCLLC